MIERPPKLPASTEATAMWAIAGELERIAEYLEKGEKRRLALETLEGLWKRGFRTGTVLDYRLIKEGLE